MLCPVPLRFRSQVLMSKEVTGEDKSILLSLDNECFTKDGNTAKLDIEHLLLGAESED